MRILGLSSKRVYALAIGVFDGVHLGHQVLLKRLLQLANGKPAGILTFRPHPQEVVRQEPMPLLNDPKEKRALLRALGIRHTYTLLFDEKVQKMKPEAFVEQVLGKTLAPKKIVVGYDFMFGQGREGTAGLLAYLGKRLGFEVYIEPPVRKEEIAISSSLLRKYVQSGKLGTAQKLLGRYYTLTGRVQKGVGRGRELGFPTVNLAIPPKRCLPPCGVYAALVKEGVFWGNPNPPLEAVCNFGVRPTFGKSSRPLFEIHLLSPKRIPPRKTLSAALISHLRKERKFPHAAALKDQMEKDRQRAKKILQRLRGRRSASIL